MTRLYRIAYILAMLVASAVSVRAQAPSALVGKWQWRSADTATCGACVWTIDLRTNHKATAVFHGNGYERAYYVGKWTTHYDLLCLVEYGRHTCWTYGLVQGSGNLQLDYHTYYPLR
jgi:hypothetical protein